MRRRRSKAGLPASWQEVAARVLRPWPLLDGVERERIEQVANRLLAKRWEASRGFALEDEMRVTVAVQAALLGLGHGNETFRNVNAIVIHPTTMLLKGERPGPSRGVVTNAPVRALGHTSASGPVFIAWDTVQIEQQAPQRRSNVILHEFAHKIDALNGTLDGTPQLTDKEQLREWIEVCSAELAALRRGVTDGTLNPYAATNPSEFFAVVTEVFFEQPALLQARKPRLYGAFARFYGQDPAGRLTPPEAPPAPPAISASTGGASAATQHITSTTSPRRPV